MHGNENKLSYRNNVIIPSMLAVSLITMMISSAKWVSYAYPLNNNATTNTSNTTFNITNTLPHIDQSQAAIQMDDIVGAMRHLDLANQILGSSPLHTLQPVTSPHQTFSPKGPEKNPPTGPALNLSKEDH